MKTEKRITAFLGVFEGKAEKLRLKIKEELNKPKAERNKSFLKSAVKEAKQLRNLVRELREDDKVEVKCPHCEKRFDL